MIIHRQYFEENGEIKTSSLMPISKKSTCGSGSSFFCPFFFSAKILCRVLFKSVLHTNEHIGNLVLFYIDHNMVFSLWLWPTTKSTTTKNADKSTTISMAIATQQYDARRIARWSTSRLHSKLLDAAIGWVPALCRPVGRHGRRFRIKHTKHYQNTTFS